MARVRRTTGRANRKGSESPTGSGPKQETATKIMDSAANLIPDPTMNDPEEEEICEYGVSGKKSLNNLCRMLKKLEAMVERTPSIEAVPEKIVEDILTELYSFSSKCSIKKAILKRRRERCLSRICSRCSATSTPEWRRSLEGATLCNACGLKDKKKGSSKKVTALVNNGPHVIQQSHLQHSTPSTPAPTTQVAPTPSPTINRNDNPTSNISPVNPYPSLSSIRNSPPTPPIYHTMPPPPPPIVNHNRPSNIFYHQNTTMPPPMPHCPSSPRATNQHLPPTPAMNNNHYSHPMNHNMPPSMRYPNPILPVMDHQQMNMIPRQYPAMAYTPKPRNYDPPISQDRPPPIPSSMNQDPLMNMNHYSYQNTNHYPIRSSHTNMNQLTSQPKIMNMNHYSSGKDVSEDLYPYGPVDHEDHYRRPQPNNANNNHHPQTNTPNNNHHPQYCPSPRVYQNKVEGSIDNNAPHLDYLGYYPANDDFDQTAFFGLSRAQMFDEGHNCTSLQCLVCHNRRVREEKVSKKLF